MRKMKKAKKAVKPSGRRILAEPVNWIQGIGS